MNANGELDHGMEEMHQEVGQGSPHEPAEPIQTPAPVGPVVLLAPTPVTPTGSADHAVGGRTTDDGPAFIQCPMLEGKWFSWDDFDAAMEEYKQQTYQPLIKRTSMKIETYRELPRKKQVVIPPGTFV